MKKKSLTEKLYITVSFSKETFNWIHSTLDKYGIYFVMIFLVGLSISSFFHYLNNGLGLAYNDARSHLDIGRRVVEGLKTGLAQLGSVWLPLDHVLMIPFVWHDWWWHSGAAGAIQNMVSFVATGILIYQTLKQLGTGVFARIAGVLIFAFNINILYLQSTAMTELLLLATMTAGSYYLLSWSLDNKLVNLIKAAFWIMMSTLTRYDGWFLLAFATVIVALNVFITAFKKNMNNKFINELNADISSADKKADAIKKGYKETEGKVILFATLGAFGVVLWFLWNLVIFKDPLYFAFGPYSAHAQQLQLEGANNLPTKHNLLLSTQIYLYALFYNSYTLPVILALIGAITLWRNKKIAFEVRAASFALTAPLFFNIIALFLGFSVLFIQGVSGDTWFNARYGIMLAPTIAIFVGYLIDKAKDFRLLIVGVLSFVLFFAFANDDAVTIDDARVGSSQKNVTEVSGWLHDNAQDKSGFILISAASHDAIIFSSGLPMKKFIHEGTGTYWESATTSPDRWARWIVLRTYDDNDSTYRLIKDTPGFKFYRLVDSYPFADIYELPEEYFDNLETEPVFGKQK